MLGGTVQTIDVDSTTFSNFVVLRWVRIYIQQNIAVRLWKLPLLFAPETKYLSFNHFVWIGERESAMKYVCMEFMLITQSVGMGILQPV